MVTVDQLVLYNLRRFLLFLYSIAIIIHYFSLFQEEEVSLFNKKKAAVQAQRAQTEKDQMASNKLRKR